MDLTVKREDQENYLIKLDIEVGSDDFEKGLQTVFVKNAKRFNIPGFRKGKAPRKIVERYYGEGVLYEDAVNEIFPSVYEEALKTQDFTPVSRPELENVDIGDDKVLKLTVMVTRRPDVILGQYKGIEVKKVEVYITEDDIQAELNKMADKNARMVTVEDRPVEKNDIVTIDYEGSVDGVPFEGGADTNHNLTIGSGQFIPGFEDQLIGANTGDEVDVNVTFPEDYHAEDLKGKAAVFKVKVNEVKKKELPEIDDEFAKDVSEFDTLDEYKEDIRKKLFEKAENSAKGEMEDELIKKVSENASVEIPQVMIENQMENMRRETDMRLSYQGINLKTYLDYIGMSMEDFNEKNREPATARVKTRLILEQIVKTENFTPSEEELQEEYESMAKQYGETTEEFKKHLNDLDIEYIMEDLKIKMAVKFLNENAVYV